MRTVDCNCAQPVLKSITELLNVYSVTHCMFSAPEEDPCNPSPCQNDGSCVDLGDMDFMCFCKDGFYGELCEEG